MIRGYPRPRPVALGLFEDPLRSPDNLHVSVFDVNPKTGTIRGLRDKFSMHNLVVSAGYDLLASLLNSEAVSGVTHFAIGTGTNTPNLSDTALQTEVFRDVITDSDHSIGAGLNTYTYFLTTGSANGNTLREIGLFNASSLGTMYARALLTPTIIKNNTKAVLFSWNIGFGAGSSVTINRLTGYIIYLDGSDTAFSAQTSYPSGATYDKLVPGSTVWFLLPTDLPAGTFALEAMVKVDNALGQVTIGLFNLDDAPDTVLTGSEVSGTVGQMTGQRIRSGTISFGAPGAAKNFGVKVKTNNASFGASVWGIRVIQTS